MANKEKATKETTKKAAGQSQVKVKSIS